MKPQEIYEMTPERVDKDISCLTTFYHSHIPSLEPAYRFDFKKNERITVRYYKDHYFDYRRIWRLASVWLDDRPVMIIQNAGREGDDFHMTFVTDPQVYGELIGYIASMVEPKPNAELRFVAVDQELEGLTEFYDHSLGTVGSEWW